MPLDFFAVFDLIEYQDIQDVFSKNLGVSSITVLPTGKPITIPSNYCSLCENNHRNHHKVKDNCNNCKADLGKLNAFGPTIKQCLNNKGCWNAEVSIIVDGVHIANWCIRQAKDEHVNENCIFRRDEQMELKANGFYYAPDKDSSMSKETFVKIAHMLYLYVNQLADKAHANFMLKQQIQEINKKNELLTQSENRYRLLFEKSNDAIFVLKLPDGRYIDANQSAMQLTGRSKEEIIKLKTSDLTPKGASNRLVPFISGNKRDMLSQVEYLKSDGTIRIANLSVLPIDSDTLFGIAQDVTEQIKASEDLKHSIDLMRYIIEHNLSAIAIHDKDLRYIYVSEKYLDHYKVKERNIIGKHHYDVFPDLPQKWRDVHQKALQGIVSSADNDPFPREDGSLEWTRWECRPWYDQNGEIGGIVVYTEVITERKNLEIILQESEEKYKFMFYNNPQPSGIYDIETLRFLEVNDAAIMHYGYSREEFLELTIKDMNPKEDIENLINDLRKNHPKISNGGPWINIKKNGEIIYVEIASHPIEYLGRRARHMLINDITDKIKNEQVIKAAQKKAEESDRLKSAFLANMSHEIRTPLNSILGFSELIVDPLFTDEDKAEFIKTMKQNSDRLLCLINDILDLSKIESGEVNLEIKPVRIHKLLDSIYKTNLLAAEMKAIKLLFNTTGLDLEFEILSDCNKIAQILNILINNALKFTDKGFVELGIYILDKEVQFYIKDSGIGINKEFHNHIFERFCQVDQSLTRKFEGTGLGLTIAKILVEILGGKIWLDSEFGKGTTFYFTVPKMYRE